MFEPEMSDFYFTDAIDMKAWIYYLSDTDGVQKRIGAFDFMAAHLAARRDGRPLAPAEIAPRGGPGTAVDLQQE